MITNGNRVLREVTGGDLCWHHTRKTPCAVAGCDEEIRYSEMTRFVVGNRVGIAHYFLCISDALDAVNQGKAIIAKENKNEAR